MTSSTQPSSSTSGPSPTKTIGSLLSRFFPTNTLSFLMLFSSVIFITLNSLFIPFITVMFAGRISKNHLDGVGLANTLYNIVVVSICAGYSSVFDTYGPPVFGSERKKDLGLVLVKCILQGAMIYLAVLGPYLCLVFLLDILPGDGGGQEFRDIAVAYLRQTSCLGYLDFVIYLICRYLAVQKREKVLTVIALFFIGIHTALNYIFVERVGWEVSGLATAGLLSRLLTLGVCVGLCAFLHHRGQLMWRPLDRSVFTDWGAMVKLGLSGCFQVFAELGLWEGVTFVSQWGSHNLLPVMLIIFQVQSILWAVTSAVSYASAILTGRSMGEGSTALVNSNIRISVAFTLVESILLGGVAFLARDPIVRLFTAEPEIVEMYKSGFWAAGLVVPLDHLQNVLSRGVLVAFGKQRFIAVVMAITCYCICLPAMCCVIILTSWGVVGVYTTFGIFCVVISVLWAWRIWSLDYGSELDKTSKRVDNVGGREGGEGMVLENRGAEAGNTTSEDGESVPAKTVGEVTSPEKDGKIGDEIEADDGAPFNTSVKSVFFLFVGFAVWSGIFTAMSFIFRK